MKNLNATGMKILKTIHLIFAIMWMGGAFSMMLLLFTTAPMVNHEMYMRSLALKMIDDYLIIIGANGIIISGILYGIFTKWGFFKHRWITAKWIITIFMMLSGTFAMGPYVNANVYEIDSITEYAAKATEFNQNIAQIIPWGILQTVLLVLVIIISVFKPWKKKSS